jgi:dTDP-4-amino-4,6-dideoxygalactose transaminase
MSAFSVPYANFALKTREVRDRLMQAFASVLDEGRYIQGPEVQAFEKDFAEYCGSPFATGVANGTCSLHLTLRAIGVGPGDEVITAPNSFIASASTIALVGAKPVFADVREDLNIDPRAIESAITPRTRALVPVHLAGRLARMPEILAVAKKHNLFVLEDAAQSVGAKLDGKRAGAWGDAASFSLHPLKNLHAYGDAGILTTNRKDLVEKLALAKNHGLQNRDRCEFWSFNCRLDEMQAALLRVHLRELDRWTEERRALAFRYHALLEPFVQVPREGPGEYHVYQTYVVLADRRDELQAFLRACGIEALVHYPTPIHLQPAAKELGYRAEDFPRAAGLSRRILSLPLYPGLTHGQQDQVAEAFAKFYRG